MKLSEEPSRARSDRALITQIQRFSLDDGPGIRTTVFFKGCPLKCCWCHNPECIEFGEQLQFFAKLCSRCGSCLTVCPTHAQVLLGYERNIDRDRCIHCFRCVDQCHTQALQRIGKQITVEELLSEVLKDIDFYINSGGGVTLSGGEPLVKWEFCRQFLKRLYERHIDTAVETAGYVPFRNFEAVLPYVGLFLYDIKFSDSHKHKKYTGVSNSLIKENLEKLLQKEAAVIIRIPMIPNINDGGELEDIARYLSGKNIQSVELLPYHEFGISKYLSLGKSYFGNKQVDPCQKISSTSLDFFAELGLKVSFH